MVQDRDRSWAIVNVVLNHRIPQNVENFLTDWGTVGSSGRILLHEVS